MNVLIVGGGGREHALAWKAAQSPKSDRVYVAPGNAGTELEPNIENVNIAVEDIASLIEFAQLKQIGLTIVGPEVPLVMGIVDAFTEAGLRCFGPTRAAAQLEGSKTFTKDFLARHHIPTAAYGTFTEVSSAIDYLNQQTFPIVIKADGLAAGKGVIIAENLQQAKATVEDMLAGNKFGDAGHRVVIEEFLQGEEASFIVVADGKHIVPMATSQDHKARDDGDSGPNTGGMGAYSPAPVVTPEIFDRVMQQVIKPTVTGMAQEGHPYTGFLYAGLMIDETGAAKVLEYNCRFGDPETQPIMMRMQSDLVDLCDKAIDGQLADVTTQWDNQASIGIVMAAGGYPDTYRKGDVIEGLPPIGEKEPNSKVFHAGTRRANNDIVTNGGRVLCVVALGDTVKQAQAKAYQLVHQIHWSDAYYRKDIGYRAIARENN